MPHEIGLLGATRIAERAIVRPSAGRPGVRVRAVAASTVDRAEAFRATHGLPVAHPNYRALLDDPGIDTVYVSLHNSAHAQWAAEAARAGKHVIVEKPLCLGRRELRTLWTAAVAGGVHVIEAVMTADHPWQAAIRALIASGELGELTGIRSRIAFDVPVGAGYRFVPELGGGAFFDTASYWLQAVRATVGLAGATAGGHSDFSGPGGVDLDFTATLTWPSGLRATLDAALAEQHCAEHEFTFTGGRVRLNNFLRPAAGPFPVNLVIAPQNDRRRVESFEPSAYYDDQLSRILHRLDQPGTADCSDAAERIAVMEDIYLDALGRRPGR
ncbi:Gfo/Idh/MocA family oxidoreductase [Streptomyces sp. NBC_00285]|uniref:Gfo/Idh/MocA family protein n=1 Tax=Streptomyces sp. NBC_00285 TaxID=2975700 RepID=UPI002E2A53EA|nr:Gfo/Idh/MocA family oxidoreductase [Streptomyces sp. NBC_00285]